MNEGDGRENRQGAGNAKCTFEVTVRFQQNSTWQGQIHWIEKNQKQNFRSALEMLKLMDEAVEEGTKEARKVGWVNDNTQTTTRVTKKMKTIAQ